MIPYGHQRWLRLLVAPRGAFTRGVFTRVFAFGAVALAVASLHYWVQPLSIPVAFHEVGGAVIALVLAFRTNTAYSRFWEARTLWGGVVNACRNLSRLARRHAAPSQRHLLEFDTWVVLFAHCMRRRLRHESEEPEFRRLLSGDALVEATAADHSALHAARQLSARISQWRGEQRLDPMMAQAAEQLVSDLVDRLGGCERIHRTPTPLGYVTLLRQLIVAFLGTLPFGLVDKVGFFVAPLSLLIAYPVLMIEGLGNELDDPFGHDANDLPLERICQTIEHDLIGGGSPPPEPAVGVQKPQD